MKNEDPKQFGPLKFWFNRFFDPKTICSNENFGLKTYFGEEKRFGVQKMCV